MGRSEDLKKCKKMWTGEEAKKAGIVYLEEGIRRFSLKSGVEFTVSAAFYYVLWVKIFCLESVFWE